MTAQRARALINELRPALPRSTILEALYASEVANVASPAVGGASRRTKIDVIHEARAAVGLPPLDFAAPAAPTPRHIASAANAPTDPAKFGGDSTIGNAGYDGMEWKSGKRKYQEEDGRCQQQRKGAKQDDDNSWMREYGKESWPRGIFRDTDKLYFGTGDKQYCADLPTGFVFPSKACLARCLSNFGWKNDRAPAYLRRAYWCTESQACISAFVSQGVDLHAKPIAGLDSLRVQAAIFTKDQATGPSVTQLFGDAYAAVRGGKGRGRGGGTSDGGAGGRFGKGDMRGKGEGQGKGGTAYKNVRGMRGRGGGSFQGQAARQ